jgi:hypothetical protein
LCCRWSPLTTIASSSSSMSYDKELAAAKKAATRDGTKYISNGATATLCTYVILWYTLYIHVFAPLHI